jgi:hypothetical protein
MSIATLCLYSLQLDRKGALPQSVPQRRQRSQKRAALPSARAFRRGLGRLGDRKEIAERVLNHTRERMHATYDVHEYIDEKREALEKWAQYLHTCGRHLSD